MLKKSVEVESFNRGDKGIAVEEKALASAGGKEPAGRRRDEERWRSGRGAKLLRLGGAEFLESEICGDGGQENDFGVYGVAVAEGLVAEVVNAGEEEE